MTSVADILFGEAIPDRPCGECTACCVLPVIETEIFSKPAGEACIHCTGSGCGIYDARPQVCRSFDCAWRRVEDMPPQSRPDRLGMMFTIEREAEPRMLFDHLFFMATAARDPLDLRSPLLNDLLTMLTRSVLPVFIYWDGRKTMIHPQPELAAAILDPEGEPDPALAEQGRQWLDRYAAYVRLTGGAELLAHPRL